MELSITTALASSAHWLMILLTLFTTMLTVSIHYGCLNKLNRQLPKLGIAPRHRVLLTITVVLFAHVIEIWVFGSAYWLASHNPDLGTLSNAANPNILECIYFAASTFTTVGYGDIAPLGPIRFLAGTEALVGFVLITWSASYTYLEMQRDWSS